METPLELEIEGLQVSAHLQDLIRVHIVKLEARYGRITSCRVAIHAPGNHHRLGEPYAVSIRLALPKGRNIDVKPISNEKDRLASCRAVSKVRAARRPTYNGYASCGRNTS